MGIRTGDQYRKALQDDREIWLEGERVKDVTSDLRFKNTVDMLAEMYDLQHRPDLVDLLTYVPDDGNGERCGLSYIEPRSAADLVRRREMVKTWMDWTGGMMGRSPDFMNIHMTGFGSAHEFFAQAGEQYGKVARDYYLHARKNDLALTHVLINPQTDRSKPVHEQTQDVAARIMEENDNGIVVRGARMVSTLAPFADEIAVFPSTYLQASDESKPFAFAFCLPVATAGMRFICRPPMGPTGGRPLDYPLSSRLDEMDAVVVFDNVLVPWDRVFINGDPYLCNSLFPGTGTMNQIMHQFAVKNLAKAEFVLGVALNLTESVGTNGFQQVQNMLAEIINAVELVRACLRASEVDCIEGPSGTVMPHPEPLWTVRTMFPEIYPRLVQILNIVGASGLIATPSVAELESERRGDVMHYYQAAFLPGDRRIELFRLAWDIACSSFGGRQALYERYFSGDPWRLMISRYQTYYQKDELKDRVWQFIDRVREADKLQVTKSSSTSSVG
ncbi:MAG: 4-hydroxyphenylacetate 3-monooxygenase, oxygenase component [Acidimicrobiales bacterium]